MKMASSSKTLSSTALFLSLNLIFFSMVSSATAQTCPIDIQRLNVCADLLSLVGVPVLNSPCCTLLGGLVDLDAAVCLCVAIKAGILGIIVDVNIALTILLNDCGKHWPSGFICN